MNGRGWKSAAASLVIHGSLAAGALALSGFSHDTERAIIIDFSLLPSRTVPAGDAAGTAVPSREDAKQPVKRAVAEMPATTIPVLPEEKPALPREEPAIPPETPVVPPPKPVPLLQEEAVTAAPVTLPEEPEEEVADDLPLERERVAPSMPLSSGPSFAGGDAAPPLRSDEDAGAAETPPESTGLATRRGRSSDRERSAPPGSGEGVNLPPAEGWPGPAGAEGEASGERPASLRDFSFIREKVQRNTRYPRLARRMGLEGLVKVSFTVCHDGEVTDIKVMKSSGISMLDRCAVEAVKNTSPFPSQNLEARVIIPIVYRLND